MIIAASVVNRLTTDKSIRRAVRFLARRPGNIYSGEYTSFDEARAAIPNGSLSGYDNAELAAWYRERLDQVQPEDYPVLFWLSRLIPNVDRVFDFGGHVGLHFYAWRTALQVPEELRWTVCDVPSVIEAAREVAKERGNPPQLFLTTDVRQSDGSTVFLASGSIQYLEPGFLWNMLASLDARPHHLVFNKLPVHETRDFVTLQDTQASYHPYTVVSSTRLRRELERLGYRQRAEWKSLGHCHVLLRADLDVPAFSGSFWSRDRA